MWVLLKILFFVDFDISYLTLVLKYYFWFLMKNIPYVTFYLHFNFFIFLKSLFDINYSKTVRFQLVKTLNFGIQFFFFNTSKTYFDMNTFWLFLILAKFSFDLIFFSKSVKQIQHQRAFCIILIINNAFML